jgi:hypothetical protein
MKGFVGIIIGVVLIGLFTVYFFIDSGLMAKQNNGQSITDNKMINSSMNNIISNLSGFYGDMNASDTAISNSPVIADQTSFVISAMGSVWLTIRAVPTLVINVLFSFLNGTLLGGSTAFYLIVGSIGGIVILLIIFSVWRFIRTGEGE